MAEQTTVITYSIPEPFPQALKSLRRSFLAQGLNVAKELNISGRIRRKLLIGTDPCTVLLVSPASEAGRMLASDSCAAGITPMHVVLSSRGSQCEVHILRILPADAISTDQKAMAAWNELQSGIVQAVEKLGMRVMLTA